MKSRLSPFIVIYTLVVILWGAWVRISRSGAGCGDHWPLCQGDLIPGLSVPATLIEFTHRISTGLYGILILFLVILAIRKQGRKHSVTLWSYLCLFFTLTEAAIGAKLVLAKWVAEDTSMYRAGFMAFHQINSMLLSGCVFLVWWKGSPSPISFFKWLISSKGFANLCLIVLILVLSMSGAVAALASTLFPSDSLALALERDFSDSAHPILKYRIAHPLLALILGGIFWAMLWPRQNSTKSKNVQLQRTRFFYLFTVTLTFGVLTLLALSPTWMRLTHLALAHCTWFAALAAASAQYSSQSPKSI